MSSQIKIHTLLVLAVFVIVSCSTSCSALDKSSTSKLQEDDSISSLSEAKILEILATQFKAQNPDNSNAAITEEPSETSNTSSCSCIETENVDQNKKSEQKIHKSKKNLVTDNSGKKFKVITITIPVDAENNANLETTTEKETAKPDEEDSVVLTETVLDNEVENQDNFYETQPIESTKDEEIEKQNSKLAKKSQENEEVVVVSKPKGLKNTFGKDKELFKKEKYEKKRSKRDVKVKPAYKGKARGVGKKNKNGKNRKY